MSLAYDGATNAATFTFPGFADAVLPDGRYRAAVRGAGVTDAAGNPIAGDHVIEFFVLRGDANHDGSINEADFTILAENFGRSPRTFSQGDFNYDGTVNLRDFNLLAGRFGTALAPAARAHPAPPGSDGAWAHVRDAADEDDYDLLEE